LVELHSRDFACIRPYNLAKRPGFDTSLHVSSMSVVLRAVVGIFAFALWVNEVSCEEHVVSFNNAPIWTVGFGVSYSDININMGETLNFASYSGHDVVLVHVPQTGTPWDQCGQNGITAGAFTPVLLPSDFGISTTNKHFTPPTCGEFFLACSVSAHCMFGQRVKVTVTSVDGSSCTSPCVGAACVTDASKVTKVGAILHDVRPVADSKWWGTGPYDALEVEVGDTVVFRTGSGFHDVATVPSASAFADCDMTDHAVVADWTYGAASPSSTCNSSSACCVLSSCAVSGMYVTYTFTAHSRGDQFFVCSIGNHCKAGQKLRVYVKGELASHALQTIWTPWHAVIVCLSLVFA